MTAPDTPRCRSKWAYLLPQAPAAACLGVALLLLGAALAGAPPSSGTDGTAPATPPPAKQDRPKPTLSNARVREGTEIVDQLGHFRTSGDRVVFSSADGTRRFIVLENLNLERVARTIADNPQRLPWGVTGTVTEYRGANFLLLQRAVLKSGVQPPQTASGMPLKPRDRPP